jgi:hypothetical protein
MSTGEVKDLMSTYSSASGQYVVDFWLLKKGYIEEVSFVDDTEVNVENSVIVSSKNNSREIYSSNTRDIYVYGVSTSPNEQYVVLNVSNKEGEKYDSYTNSLSEQARLLILDRQSGKQLNDIEGSFPQWSNDAR